MSASVTNINVALKAKTVEKLIELQVINNAVNNIHYNYQTPVWTGEEWVIWFFVDIKKWNNPMTMDQEVLDLIRGSQT